MGKVKDYYMDLENNSYQKTKKRYSKTFTLWKFQITLTILKTKK